MGDLIRADFGKRSDPEMTKRQVALYTQRSTRWVEQQMSCGLSFHRDGSKAMFWRSEVDAWLEGRRAING